MIERQEPTHNLRIDVPLNLSANPAAEDWDIQAALAEALKLIVSVARVGTLGLLCDNPSVTLESSGVVPRSGAAGTVSSEPPHSSGRPR